MFGKPGAALVFLLISTSLVVLGCAPRFSALLTESWSENYALAMFGTEASHPEINDADLKTWGITQPPERVYAITFPEEKKIDRIVVYTGNVVAYKLYSWDKESGKWKVVGAVDSLRGSQQVYSQKEKLQIPRFIHRVNIRTDKIRLGVNRAQSDGVVTTRNPPKNAKILNHWTDYLDTGRGRIRIDLYDIFKLGPATIREIEAYSYAEKPETQ